LQEEANKITVIDRLALGFLNGLIGLPTGIILWAALIGLPWGVIPWLPAVSILWFTLAVAIIGAVLNSNFLVNFYGKVWQFLWRWFGGNA